MLGRALGPTLVLIGVGVVGVSLVGFVTDRGRPPPQAYGTVSIPATATTSLTVPRRSSSAAPAPAGVATPSSVLPAPPTTLTLTSLHVSAPVVPVGLNGRSVQVPADPAQVGWWTASAPAGSPTGSTVIVGHVDTAATGRGALYGVGVGRLKSGNQVSLHTATGASFTYRVYAQQVLTKSQGLPATVFDPSHQPRLVLITCGGPFDRDHGTYLDNVVIYAAPTPQ